MFPLLQLHFLTRCKFKCSVKWQSRFLCNLNLSSKIYFGCFFYVFCCMILFVYQYCFITRWILKVKFIAFKFYKRNQCTLVITGDKLDVKSQVASSAFVTL